MTGGYVTGIAINNHLDAPVKIIVPFIKYTTAPI
jgi:hypothetical protein